MKAKDDVRYGKADYAIRQAFLGLLEKKNYNKISVKEIIEAAKINRSTFYAHYLDKEDLMDKIQEELMDDLIGSLPDVDWSAGDIQKQLSLRSSAFVTVTYKQKALVSLLLSENAEHSFEGQMRERAEQTFYSLIDGLELTIPSKYAIALLSSSVINFLTTWVRSDYEESPAELADILASLMPDILLKVLNTDEEVLKLH
ncbi:TetR family transcriptional regulator [Fructobacillus sp. M2-14]|uniref:TetR family transcriptional regulator n=1 Tax=Fructobacillus broussonetiae TaxID=2713173 RepID=A0ABS5QZ99_9LACO|nr:TetR/AcrR family transcriptional regulator [Fructobacillus broussonetiae]MBS9338523.1 TetR family transcriptional regulator [Fructobacillus broussonetiae]